MTLFDLTDPGLEPLTSRIDSSALATEIIEYAATGIFVLRPNVLRKIDDKISVIKPTNTFKMSAL